VADLIDAARLYLRLVRARIRSQAQYPASLALETVGMLVGSFLDFVAILVIFANIPQLGGWSLGEVALLYALSTVAFALTDLAIGHLDLFPLLIRDGNFDLILVRPRSTLFQIATADFQLRRLGKLAQGLAVLVFALSQLRIDWTIDRALVLVIAPLSGAVIFGSIWIAVICIAFWTVEGREAANAFTYGGTTLVQYPVNVYERWLRAFLAFVVPTAFVSYFPALYVLGKADPLGLPIWLQPASIVVAMLAAAVAGTVWRVAVRHYRSAGG
jgi:ABC-2 type transport system permease protein